MHKHYNIFETKAGWVGLARSDAGISHVVLPHKSPDQVSTLLHTTNAQLDENAFGDLPQRLMQYFDDRKVEFESIIDWTQVSAFDVAVWQATSTIPYGQTRSYGWVAAQIGKPKAARAVGQALGRNPTPILIPCHRVITSSGKLGGFSSGIDMKQTLLDTERNAK